MTKKKDSSQGIVARTLILIIFAATMHNLLQVFASFYNFPQNFLLYLLFCHQCISMKYLIYF